MKPRYVFRAVAILFVIELSQGNVFSDDPIRRVPNAIVDRFTLLDRNEDKQLSADEFKGLFAPTEAAIALRDFGLFDRDGDNYLSLDEFWSLPTHATDQRGPLPDPLTAVVDQFAEIMDQLFDHWDQAPERTIPLHEFLTGFSKATEEPITPQLQRDADPDRNGRMTREEVRRLIEIQAGVRRSDGKPLREANGRVCLQIQFQNCDIDHDDRVTLEEFLQRGYMGEKAGELFKTNDVDNDQFLSWEEWCRFRMSDPIGEFWRIDKNLDGQVDPTELLAGTPDWIKISAECAFPGFDTDHNGTLSLDEYRLTMSCNMVANWNRPIIDSDGDGLLSRSEFQFEGAAPVLRYVYFVMLDRNEDGQLDPQEFPFTTKSRREFYSLNADGSGWKRMFGLKAFPSVASPSVSPDGKWIAFDGHGPMKDISEQMLLITDVQGENLRSLGLGMMPTWSSDRRQLSYSWQGIRTINADGTDSQQISRGWGPQWSPDGKRILYYLGLNIFTLDVASGKSTLIYNASSNGYQRIFWNMTWSPDSQRICFKGLTPGGVEEIATIDTNPEKPRFQVHHTGTGIATDFAWHPDGNRIVFCMNCPERAVSQLYEFNPNSNKPAQLVQGQDPKATVTSVCWMPDGKKMVVVVGDD